jgi:hypothetical protein
LPKEGTSDDGDGGQGVEGEEGREDEATARTGTSAAMETGVAVNAAAEGKGVLYEGDEAATGSTGVEASATEARS